MDNEFNEREIVWVSKDLAEKVKGLEKGGKEEERIVMEYIEKGKRDIRGEIESLDDEVVQYKALMINARKAFKNTFDEHIDNAEKLWENFWENTPDLKKYVAKCKQQMEPLKDDLKQITEYIDKINTWRFDSMMDTMEKFNSLDAKSKEMLSFFLQHENKNSGCAELSSLL